MILEPLPGTVIYVYRSAITGRFVSKAYAKANPKTTIRQTVTK